MPPPIPDPSRLVESAGDDANARARSPLPALAASLLLHGLLAVAILNAPLPDSIRKPDDGVIAMRLVPRPAPQTEPPELRNPPEPEPEPRTIPQAEPDTAMPEPPQEAVVDAEPAPTGPADDIETGPSPEDAVTLRARILQQVGAPQPEARSHAGERLPWAASGERVPGLPGVRGWLSGYVGPVQPSAHTWKENDGSSRARYVLADGTVVCTRRRAPTIDELMNPWKSIAVTMGSICGRERPRAPDFDDPRVQPPPSATTQSGRGD